ncbi:hypothetical protein BJ912DRAFT_1058132 [Pholiota molesta]|nr:hypothetical protein BJ912DRAFT_1058132 [Pholiota molesta]
MNLIFENARPWYTRIDNHLEPFLQHRDIIRWRLASRALARYSLSSFPSTWAFAYVVPHAELQSATDPKGAGYGDITRMSCAAALLGAMYGAPHFIPWNTNDFPTAIEKLLWRAATVIVAASGTYFGTMFVVSTLVFRLAWPRQQGSNRGWTSWLPRRDQVEAALIASGAVVYCGAGAFLVVESFRQLFYLPPGAYELPSWTNYFPHFT